MSKQCYMRRDKTRQVFEILQVIRNERDCNISRISRNSNMSHYQSDHILKLLLNAGLVTEQLGKSRYNNRGGPESRCFYITEAGQMFHNQLTDLYEQFSKLGIDSE